MTKRLMTNLFVILSVSILLAPVAKAYSLNSSESSSIGTDLNFNGDLSQLGQPFQEFMTNVQSIQPSDILNFSPSIPPDMQDQAQSMFTQASNWISGLFNEGARWIANLIVSKL